MRTTFRQKALARPHFRGYVVLCTHGLANKNGPIFSRMSIFNYSKINTLLTFLQKCVESPYYSRSSSAPLLPRIQIPCYLLFAQDDPFIDSSVLERINLPPHVLVWRTAHGGHLGFLGMPGHWGGFQWMDHLLMHWHQAA